MRVEKMRVAVIAAGISGLVSACVLAKAGVEVVLYETDDYLSGHAKTVTLEGVHLDLSFMVFNQVTYPDTMEFFECLGPLGVDMETSNMSFSVSLDKGHGYEWGSHNGLSSLFAQKKNMLNPYFWQMIREIIKFKDDVISYLEELEKNPDIDRSETLGQFIKSRGYSELFQKAYLIPICGSIWSCPPQGVMNFSAISVLSFCRNNHLLELFGQPQWLTIRWHSHGYVNKIMEQLKNWGCRIKSSSEVSSVWPTDAGWTVACGDGSEELYNGCIMAVHASDGLRMLGSHATFDERRILGAFQYVYRFDNQPLSPAQEQQIVRACRVDKQERRWQYLLTSDLLHRAGFIKSPYIAYPIMAPKKSMAAMIAKSGGLKGKNLARTGSGSRSKDPEEREARFRDTLGPVPPPKEVPSPTRTEVVLASQQKRKDAPSASAALEIAGGRPSKQHKGDKGKTASSPVRLSMKRFREQMNEVIPEAWFERFPSWNRQKRKILRKQYQYQAALLTAIEAEDEEGAIVDLKEVRDVLEGQVKSLELQVENSQKKYKDDLDTLRAEKESSEASLNLTVKRKEGEIRQLTSKVADLQKSESELKRRVAELESMPPTDLKDVLDCFRKTRYWRKRLEIERHFGCMQYRRCCIETGVDLLPLEEDDFDPNEEDPEPVDDSVALYLDALEEDTLRQHTSDEESAGEEEVPEVVLAPRTDSEGTVAAPDRGQTTDETPPQDAPATENPPVPPATQDAPDPSSPVPSGDQSTPAA